MLKTTGIVASLFSAVCVIIGLWFYQRGPQGSSIVGQSVIEAMDAITFILYVAIIFAFSFSLSFTPLLGVALLVRLRTPPKDYRKAVQTFVVSLFPFAIFLCCFFEFLLPGILHKQ
jgi:hypothetical protein